VAIYLAAELGEAAMAHHEVREARVKLAHDAAEYAQSITPVGVPPDKHPGEHRDSISVVANGDDVRVHFGLDTWNLLEYGSIHNEEFAVRARTELHFNGR
jgi:hypothetical protein